MRDIAFHGRQVVMQQVAFHQLLRAEAELGLTEAQAAILQPQSLLLDYGPLSSKEPADATLEEAGKQIRQARNTIFALDYLSSLDWGCFNVRNVRVDTVPKRFNFSETRYLLRSTPSTGASPTKWPAPPTARARCRFR